MFLHGVSGVGTPMPTEFLYAAEHPELRVESRTVTAGTGTTSSWRATSPCTA